MNKFVKYSFLIALIGMISCNQRYKENPQKETQPKTLLPLNWAGKFYFVAPELDSANCVARGSCDCCVSKVLFLNDSEFIYVAYCLQDDTYLKGVYKVNEDEIVFNSDKLRVDYLTDIIFDSLNNVTDTTYLEVHNAQEKYVFKWKVFLCNERICFIEKGSDYIQYATPVMEEKNQFIQEMKKDSIWYKLGLD